MTVDYKWKFFYLSLLTDALSQTCIRSAFPMKGISEISDRWPQISVTISAKDNLRTIKTLYATVLGGEHTIQPIHVTFKQFIN